MVYKYIQHTQGRGLLNLVRVFIYRAATNLLSDIFLPPLASDPCNRERFRLQLQDHVVPVLWQS